MLSLTRVLLFSGLRVQAIFWSTASEAAVPESGDTNTVVQEAEPDNNDDGNDEISAVEAESQVEEDGEEPENDDVDGEETEDENNDEGKGEIDGDGLLDAAAGTGETSNANLNMVETLKNDNELQSLVSNGNIIIIKPAGAHLLDDERLRLLNDDALALRTVRVNEHGELLDSNSNKIKDRNDNTITEEDLKDGEKVETDNGNTVEKADDGEVVIEEGPGDGSESREDDLSTPEDSGHLDDEEKEEEETADKEEE